MEGASPTAGGSPAASAGPSAEMSGAELAMRMIHAAESAAAAATAATQAVAALSPTSGGAQSSAAGGNQWYKVLPLNCRDFAIGGGKLNSICLQWMASTVQT